jgi:hypothetical protein
MRQPRSRRSACALALAVMGILAQTAPRGAQETPSLSQPTTLQQCNVTAALERAQCRKQVNAGGRQQDTPCEDEVNLQHRMCMLEVLERSRAESGPARNNDYPPVRPNLH